jgi:osmotically-inducible protein OsmY
MTQFKSGIVTRIAVTFIVLGSCFTLTACAAAFAGAGVAAVAAGSTEKGLGTSTTDGIIKVKINEAFFNSDTALFTKVEISVNAGAVLLTGTLPTPEDKIEATQLVWQVRGVNEVLNEIEVQDSSSIKDFAKDFAAAAQLRGKLIGDQEVSSLNFSVDVVNGTVYLSGIASSQDEINRVVEHARSLRFATDVKNYIRVNDDDRE